MFDKIFDKFSKTKNFVSKELRYSFYNIVSQEIQQGIKDEGVWAKSFADAQGDEQKTKAIYIELMVERLILKHEAELELKKKEKKPKEIEREQREERRREAREKRSPITKFGSFILNIIFVFALFLILVWGASRG